MRATSFYRRMPLIAVLLITTASVATAHGARQSPASSAAPAQAPSGTLDIALAAIGNEALDPLKGPNNNGVYLRLLFDPLVGVDPSGKTISKATGIARDWRISPDGRTYTFLLRRGVRFHDGAELTSADVVFTLQRMNAPENLTTTGRTIANQLVSVRARGKYTVQVRLKAATATLLYRLSPLVDVAGLVVSKKYFDRVGQAGFDQRPMGSGPYRFVSRQAGSSMTFRAVNRHWLIGRPRYATVQFRIVSEESTRVALLRSGDADFVDVGIEQRGNLQRAGFRSFRHSALNPLLLFMNLGNRNSPLRDIDARKALSFAINRQELNRFLFNNQGVVTGNIFPSQLGNVPIATDPFNLNRARSFMSETAFRPGGDKLTLELNAQVRGPVPQMLQVAQTLQSYWRAIGVDVNIVYGDYGTWRAKAVDRSLAPNAVELLDIGGRPDNSDTSIVWLSCGGLLTQACERQMDIRAQRWATAQNDTAYAQRARSTERYIKNRYLALPILGLPVYYVGSRDIPATYSVGAIALGFHVQGLVWNR